MKEKYKEEKINLPAGNIPPRFYRCDCGKILSYPDYICEHCKKQFVFYVPMGFVNLR